MTDYRYFKFRPINKFLVESLVSPSWYFASPADLNDPFDCNINLRAAFLAVAKAATGRRKTFLDSALEHANLLDNFGETVAKVGVCSFSLRFREPLLWSHYADQHRGVCVLYRFPEEFINSSENQFLGLDKVKYGARSLHNMLATNSMEMNSFINELLKTFLTTKSPSWRYEGEARIIRGEPGLFEIPGDFVEQICFGFRTTQADIELVQRLARAYTSCTRFAQMVRNDREFGLVARKL